MRGKFTGMVPDGWGCACIVIISMVFVVWAVADLADLNATLIIMIAFIVAFLVLVAVDRILAHGRYIAGRDKISFLRHTKRHDFSYSDIADVSLDVVVTHTRYSTIAYAKIILELKNGKKFDCTDRLESDDKSSMNELNKLLKEHQFTQLKNYIMSKIGVNEHER